MDGGDRGEGALEKLRRYLDEEVGYDVYRYRRDVVLRGAEQRMRELQVSRLASYLEQLRGDRGEGRRLIEQLEVKATCFFRDPEAYEALAGSARWLIEEAPGPELRVWVAGCATGEEPYSLAMILTEALEAAGRPLGLRLWATDIDEASLETARRGCYPAAVAAEIAPDRLRRFLVGRGDGYEITPALRARCRFAHHDLLADPPLSRIDLLSCRNLLMYLEPELQARLRPVLHYALRPGGYLLLGPAEGVGLSAELFESVSAEACLFRAGASASRRPPPRFPLSRRATGPRAPEPGNRPVPHPPGADNH